MDSSASRTDSCQGMARQVHVRGAPAEMANHALGAVEVAVEDHDPLEAVGDEGVDDGSRRAAGAQHDRVARHLLAADELVQGGLEAGHVGVVADRASCRRGR